MAKYKWNYCSVGGVVRVVINSGDDIAHLGELDKKMWTVMSCPVEGLEFDPATLKMLDADHDGSIKIGEIVDAANWLTAVLKKGDILIKGGDVLPLDEFNTADPEGKRLHDSAVSILKNLGLKKKEISLSDASDSKAIFAGTLFNGDGIITESTPGDGKLAAVVKDCISCMGAETDKSGADGVGAEKIEAFYAACESHNAWLGKATGEVLPYGEDTAAALAAVEAVKEKISDYYMRCKLIAFDENCQTAVDVASEKIAAIGGGLLNENQQDIIDCPIARPTADAVLHFDGINPAWKSAFDRLKTLVLDKQLKGRKGMKEEEWKGICAAFAPYTAWMGSKEGMEVEALGGARIAEILKENGKQALLDLVAKDKAVEAESNSIDDVNKLLHYLRDFYSVLKNFVVLSDFYNTDPGVKSIFEAGELFIDQRCCRLCIKVKDMSTHADMAGLSGMFLIYCKCTSRTKGETMDIMAVMTDGGVKYLRPGKNAIFYDRGGNVWDATVTKVVDNPISIKQAFFRPYIKFWNFCVEKIQKNAEDKDAKAIEGLQSKADINITTPTDNSKKQVFDIAKFAGIFAAIGLALGYIGQFCTALISGVKTTPVWITLLIILGVMLCISGPSCFLAWTKLRKRDLGPVLNANGWAINSAIKVNILFGATLTKTAKYPHIRMKDPYRNRRTGLKIFLWAVLILCIGVAILYFTDNLGIFKNIF